MKIKASDVLLSKFLRYEWISTVEEDYSTQEDGLVSKRVSDWDNAEHCATCGRDIVHVYWVEHSDGTIQPYGSEHLHLALGLPKELSNRKLIELQNQTRSEDLEREQHIEKYKAIIDDRKVPLGSDAVGLSNTKFLESRGKPAVPPVWLTNGSEVLRADDLAVDRFLQLFPEWREITPKEIRGA